MNILFVLRCYTLCPAETFLETSNKFRLCSKGVQFHIINFRHKEVITGEIGDKNNCFVVSIN